MLPRGVVSAAKTGLGTYGSGNNCTRRLLLVSLLLAISACAGAQTRAAGVPVTLGQSVIALTGPWKFHVGDNPQWADPGFDDAGWQAYELMPGHSPLTPEE